MTRPDPTLRLFSAVWCTYFASVGLFTTYAPLWFKELGLSALAIGAIASLQAWSRVIAPYGWGWLADHRGRRVGLLRWSVVLAAASTVALALLGPLGLGAIGICVLAMFLSNGAVVPLAEAAVAQHLSRSATRFDVRRYARVRVWGSIGFVVSVVAFGFVLQFAGVARFPWFVAGMVVLLGLAVWRLPGSIDGGPVEPVGPGALAVLRRPEVAWFFASVFLTVLAHTSLYAFFSLYLDALGRSRAAVGVLWAIGVLAEIVFFWFQGSWFERRSLHAWLMLAAGCAVLRFAAMAGFGQATGLLVLTQCLHALTFAAHHAACIALIHRYFPGRLRSRGQALYTTLGYGLSGVLGGLAGGALIEQHGHAAVFWAASAAAAGAMACAWRSHAHARAAAPPG